MSDATLKHETTLLYLTTHMKWHASIFFYKKYCTNKTDIQLPTQL